MLVLFLHDGLTGFVIDELRAVMEVRFGMVEGKQFLGIAKVLVLVLYVASFALYDFVDVVLFEGFNIGLPGFVGVFYVMSGVLLKGWVGGVFGVGCVWVVWVVALECWWGDWWYLAK